MHIWSEKWDLLSFIHLYYDILQMLLILHRGTMMNPLIERDSNSRRNVEQILTSFNQKILLTTPGHNAEYFANSSFPTSTNIIFNEGVQISVYRLGSFIIMWFRNLGTSIIKCLLISKVCKCSKMQNKSLYCY